MRLGRFLFAIGWVCSLHLLYIFAFVLFAFHADSWIKTFTRIGVLYTYILNTYTYVCMLCSLKLNLKIQKGERAFLLIKYVSVLIHIHKLMLTHINKLMLN